MRVAVSLSVIIPMAPDEPKPVGLIDTLPPEIEIILSQETGRAASLNAGAAKASGEYLWFLHADSSLPKDGLEKLQQAIAHKPDALHYFNLAFAGGGWAMKLNSWGANFRSGFLGCPFGDQGFCLPKPVFQQLGTYPEAAPYGEDHLFVWQAHKAGVKLNQVHATITTSARKYQQKGWLQTTLRHQYLWLKQVVRVACQKN
jgi:GT2 family glycosyltransferase